MIEHYPYFGFPNYRNYRRPYSYYSPYYNSHNSRFNSAKNVQNSCSPSDFLGKKQGDSSCSSSNRVNTSKNDCVNDQKHEDCNVLDDDRGFSQECFEIFGIKLHFDDLLIIALLFFLYQEDVKDEYLYISLVLLLLS